MQELLNDFAVKLAAHEDKANDEFNAIFDENEANKEIIKERDYILAKQHEALLKQDKDKKIFIANEDSLKRQSVNFQQKAANLEHQIKVLKKEAKTQKEQTKRNQASIKQRDARIKTLEKRNKSNSGNDKMDLLPCVYSKGNDVLLIFPSKLTFDIEGNETKQTVLLYTNKEGCFVSCVLDSNNELSTSTFIKNNAEISDRTKAMINKNCIQISKEAGDFAQDWLYRINVMQGGELRPLDLTCHGE